MVTLQDLSLYLNDLLHVERLTDYCINGLQVEGDTKIMKAATAVSASLDTIEEAVELGVQALIVHHGLFWNQDSHAIVQVKRKKIKLLLDHGISLFGYHLPLDAHQEVGNNWKAARDLGWYDLQPFGKFNGVEIGVKGKFSPRPREAFRVELEKYYVSSSHSALGGKEIVESAALISGGAYKSLSDACREGVDCFITGNFDEPVWNQAFEEKINFFALGHTATEKVGPKALAEALERRFGIACRFIDTDNPF